jgi:hypothetical protein
LEQEVINKLAQIINLTWYMGGIGKRTRYGERPGPEAWHFTKRLMKEDYSVEETVQVIDLLEQVGAMNEISAAEWLANRADQLPDQDGDGE